MYTYVYIQYKQFIHDYPYKHVLHICIYIYHIYNIYIYHVYNARIYIIYYIYIYIYIYYIYILVEIFHRNNHVLSSKLGRKLQSLIAWSNRGHHSHAMCIKIKLPFH